MSLDEAIRRKLIADGDGNGDDRRITSLAKTFCLWTQEGDLSSSSAESLLNSMRELLAQTECSMEKTAVVYEACLADKDYYENLGRKIDDQIQEALQRISECRQELQEAKLIRKHRQEYDQLAKVIQTYPERKETQKKLEEVKKDITVSSERLKELEEKFEKRRSQFYVLMTSLAELDTILKAEKDREADEAMDTG